MNGSAEYRDFLAQSYADLSAGINSFRSGTYPLAVYVAIQGVEKLLISIALYYGVHDVMRFSPHADKIAAAITDIDDRYIAPLSRYSTLLANASAIHQASSDVLVQGSPPMFIYRYESSLPLIDQAIHLLVDCYDLLEDDFKAIITPEMVQVLKENKDEARTHPEKVLIGQHTGKISFIEPSDNSGLGKIHLDITDETGITRPVWIYASTEQINQLRVSDMISIDKSDRYQFFFDIHNIKENIP